jgi:hypothetical protein
MSEVYGQVTSDHPIVSLLMRARCLGAAQEGRPDEGEGDRLLDQLLKRDHLRGQAPPESLDSLPLGGPTLPPTMTYWRKL